MVTQPPTYRRTVTPNWHGAYTVRNSDSKVAGLQVHVTTPGQTLNCFSKIYENHIKNHIVNSMNNYISPYFSAYRKGYNSQHVLIRLFEEWTQHLDNNSVAGGDFMDLSKTFDCLPHNLLIAKLAAYSADENLLVYIYSYLSNRKQCVRINNVQSRFQNVVSGYLKGPLSVLLYLIVSLMISFTSSIKLVCMILLMITL